MKGLKGLNDNFFAYDLPWTPYGEAIRDHQYPKMANRLEKIVFLKRRGIRLKQPDLHSAKRFIRPITYGIVLGAGVCFILLVAMSAVMGLGSVPQSLSTLFATVSFVAGGFVAGYISAVCAHEKGMLLGICCGICLFLILSAASFAICDSGVTGEGIAKLISVLLASAIGGVLGVNKKGHFK